MPEPKARELAAEPTAEGLETRPLRNPRRGMYVLPSLFTAGNIAAGFYAIMQSVQGSAAEPEYYNRAALAIGFAVLFDGLDGRIARMTNTSSEFGKELDSLADVITFGVAPSVLAYIWGFRLLPHSPYHDLRERIVHIGVFVCFLFLICGASRLARFNISVNPQPRNPGRPGSKYFVGMPIPAGAGVIAAVIHFYDGWRFWSGKEIRVGEDRHPFQMVALLALVGVLLVMYSEWMLIVLALGYLVSGVLARLAYSWERRRRQIR
jgi:CDP-diacylglycerol--serine O-phosphatidyltransferase